MKLTRLDSNETINLPNSFLWQDEFAWQPVVINKEYAIDGTLIVESGFKRAGRPITLIAPDSMAWVSRETLKQIYSWVETPELKFKLSFEFESDKREFTVIFDCENNAFASEPVKGYSEMNDSEYYITSLKFLEV